MKRTSLSSLLALTAALSVAHCSPSPAPQAETLTAHMQEPRPLAADATYPRMMACRDGSLLATATHVDTEHHLQAMRSSDAGVSWVPVGEIAAGPGDLDNAFVVELDTTVPGAQHPRLLAAYRNHDKNAQGVYTTFRITVSRSDDAGATWQFHSEVTSMTGLWGVWEPFMQLTQGGRLEVYYAKEYAADDQDIVVQSSADGGLTWGPLQTVAGAGIISRDGMPGVARYQLSQVCIFESVVDNHFRIMTVQSDDGGVTWAQRSALHDPPEGHNSGSPQIVALPGNTLVAAYMTDEASSVVSWPDHANIQLQLAQTEGMPGPQPNWNTPLIASPQPSYWPALLARGANDFWVVYDHGGSALLPVDLRVTPVP